jgi:hypothetical protein
MKVLMLDVVNRTYKFIKKLFDEETGGELLLRLATRDLVPQWDNPILPSAAPGELQCRILIKPSGSGDIPAAVGRQNSPGMRNQELAARLVT